MRYCIVTTSPVFGVTGKVAQFIADRGWELVRCVDKSRPGGGISDHAASMDFFVAGSAPVTAEHIKNAPKLRAVLRHGVGVGNIDIAAATARGIPVLNAPGGNTNAVVELVIGGMIALARHIPKACADIRAGVWERQTGTEIAGKTLGIVGLGNIGKALALAAGALGMRVMAVDSYPDYIFVEEHGVRLVDLNGVLGEADYVSLHVSGGEGNEKLIGAAQLALMKPTACLLNYARGDLVDLDALDRALAANALAGAAVDAYPAEPPAFDHPLFLNPRVVFTPHTGGDTKESSERLGMMNAADIETLINGGRSPRTLNPEIYR